MIEYREPLEDKDQTGDAMYKLIERFYGDLDIVRVQKRGKAVPVSSLDLRSYYNLVRSIPYRRDTKPVEVISRPYYIFKHRALGMDCKKKAILLGSYCKGNGIPYRLIASSRRPDKRFHHVFPQGFLRMSGDSGPEWVNLDATYGNYRLGEHKTATAAEIL
jgi:transglutaminase-like putative cysteine protease